MSGSSGRLRAAVLLAVLLPVAACAGPQAATPPGSVTPTAPGVTTGPTPGPPSTEPAPAPACGAGWGSGDKTAPDLGPAPVVALRAGGDDCADRVEFDLAGPAAGYVVGYVDEVVQDGSGAPVTVPGGARLRVQLRHPAYDAAGRATLPDRVGEPLPAVSGYRSLQSVVFAGSFEGESTFGVGVRARLPFRVSVVDGERPRSRIVLEVAHAWS